MHVVRKYCRTVEPFHQWWIVPGFWSFKKASFLASRLRNDIIPLWGIICFHSIQNVTTWCRFNLRMISKWNLTERCYISLLKTPKEIFQNLRGAFPNEGGFSNQTHQIHLDAGLHSSQVTKKCFIDLISLEESTEVHQGQHEKCGKILLVWIPKFSPKLSDSRLKMACGFPTTRALTCFFKR